MTETVTSDNKTWLALDYFKFATAILMVANHSFIWWLYPWGYLYTHPFIEKYYYYAMPLVFGSMLIPLTAGASFQRIIVHKKLQTAANKKTLFFVTSRIIVLFFFGYFVNIAAHGWDGNPWRWHVLHFIGLAYLVSTLIERFFGIKGIIVLTLIVLSVYPLTRLHDFEISEWLLVQILIGDPYGSNSWNFVPWYALFGTGILVSYNLDKYKRIPLNFCFIGLTAVIVALVLKTPAFAFSEETAYGNHIFLPPWSVVLLTIGIGLPGICLLDFLKDKLPNKTFIRDIGNNILIIYTINIISGNYLINLIRESGLRDNNNEPLYTALMGMLLFVIINITVSIGFTHILNKWVLRKKIIIRANKISRSK